MSPEDLAKNAINKISPAIEQAKWEVDRAMFIAREEATRQAYEDVINFSGKEAIVLEEYENDQARLRNVGVLYNPDAMKWRKIQAVFRQRLKELSSGPAGG